MDGVQEEKTQDIVEEGIPQPQDTVGKFNAAELPREVILNEMSNFFGYDVVDRNDHRLQSRMMEVFDWASNGADDMGDVLLKIKSVVSKIGDRGDNMMRILHYIRLDRKRAMIEKKQQSMEQ